MKVIQIMFDEEREQEIDEQYERAYAGVEDPLGKDFEGWENEGVWPPMGSAAEEGVRPSPPHPSTS